jgi:hypothetical protein
MFFSLIPDLVLMIPLPAQELQGQLTPDREPAQVEDKVDEVHAEIKCHAENPVLADPVNFAFGSGSEFYPKIRIQTLKATSILQIRKIPVPIAMKASVAVSNDESYKNGTVHTGTQYTGTIPLFQLSIPYRYNGHGQYSVDPGSVSDPG